MTIGGSLRDPTDVPPVHWPARDAWLESDKARRIAQPCTEVACCVLVSKRVVVGRVRDPAALSVRARCVARSDKGCPCRGVFPSSLVQLGMERGVLVHFVQWTNKAYLGAGRPSKINEK